MDSQPTSASDNLPIYLIRQSHGCNGKRKDFRTYLFSSSAVDHQEGLSRICDLAPPQFKQFINLLSNSNLTVGKGLRSCTNTVQPADAFDLDGRRVVLIDTPGFDDTSLSDTDVLNMIAAFLEVS